MKHHYMPKNAICGPEQALEFKKDQIDLKIHSKGINVGNWRVLPLTTPVVMFCVAHCTSSAYIYP